MAPPGVVGLRRFIGLERLERPLQLRDRGRLTITTGLEHGLVGSCRVEHPKELVSLPLDPAELLRTDRDLGVVGIEETGGRAHGSLCVLQGRRRPGEGGIAPVEL